MHPPRLGLFLPTMAPRDATPDDVVDAARHAEALGFESVWAVDQLISGRGVPILDSTVALAAAAGATSDLRLGYGVLVLPLRPVVWVAKEVASLQVVSGGRLLLGVGVGGDRHDRSWAAAGVPRRDRGRRTDAALAALPDLISGRSTTVGDAEVALAPGTDVPPILVGGTSEAALARTARHGDGWFGMPMAPAAQAGQVQRLEALASAHRRPTPGITGSMMIALDGDPTVPGLDELTRRLTDPDGLYGMPAEGVPDVLVTGGPDDAAQRLQDWADLGAERVVITVAAGSWHRQAELLAGASELVTSA
jgi:alkanesulfonate monooxygenase SsuD/methylene tetrahydromethanopterin reductase-like flavin-dependent oxidoreductase (luciferase family)